MSEKYKLNHLVQVLYNNMFPVNFSIIIEYLSKEYRICIDSRCQSMTDVENCSLSSEGTRCAPTKIGPFSRAPSPACPTRTAHRPTATLYCKIKKKKKTLHELYFVTNGSHHFTFRFYFMIMVKNYCHCLLTRASVFMWAVHVLFAQHHIVVRHRSTFNEISFHIHFSSSLPCWLIVLGGPDIEIFQAYGTYLLIRCVQIKLLAAYTSLCTYEYSTYGL